ncbi:hypothetical protein [Leptolyngbya sp. FACHB-17]|uniref:hypothetical protein n=1 Tax=unclassified Leptolyngbya TaxID=2650499 RepID=UPI001680E965|nr:hypothetical protein [Leptolyngbya sp. FACHB-17]MBD2080958.1 hypothetical protein [Leptolyngbya sp. FACHB-17]
MNAQLVPSYSNTRSLGSSRKGNTSEDNSSVRAVAIVLGLLIKFLGLLLLVGLFLIAGLVWIWLAGFRGGWRLGNWLAAQGDASQDKVALELLNNLIVTLVAPLALFGDWAEQIIRERFQIQFPPKIDLREIIETQLKIKLPENSPWKIDSADTSTKINQSK